MIKKLLAFLILISPLIACSQEIEIVHFDQLEKRLNAETENTLVVNFWATWCGPCVKELPNFEKANETFKNQKVKVLLVSLDYPNKLETELKPFVLQNKIKSDIVLLDEANANKWIDKVSPQWSGSIPSTLIINPVKKTRNLYEKEFTYPELETLINQLK